MNIRRFLISISFLVVAIVAAFFIMQALANSKKDPESRAKEKAKIFVRVNTIKYSDMNTSIKASGRLSSQSLVDLSVEVSGKILQGDISLKEGTNFKKGDLLVRIFDEEAKNNLKASKSRFLNSIAGILPDMKIDFTQEYDKWNKFFNDININKELPALPKFNTDKEKIFLASRNILNDYYTIESAQVRLSKYKIYAPFKGTFTNVMMEVGSVANPGTRIATMIKTDNLELEVPVKAEDIYWIKKGDKVKVSTNDGQMTWWGKVVRKSDYVDPASQSIMVYVAVEPKKDKPLYQGQYLQAEFSDKIVHQSFEIPRNALFNKNEVYLVEDGVLKRATVSVLKLGSTTALISGPKENSTIVVEPLINAAEGVVVEILK